MKNYSAQSNLDHEQPLLILVISLTYVVYLLLQIELWRNIMARAKANQTNILATVAISFCLLVTAP